MEAGKVTVITGASGGIGAALARELGKAGHRLVLAARRQEELERVGREAGEGAVAVPTDVTRREEVERLRDRALETFGRIDVWVNNAGRGISKRVMELTDADLDEMMAVNVKSALYGMQAVVPHFQRRGSGHLINVSSFLGRVPLVPIRSAYNAAKAALNALTANLRVDLKAEYPGIHVSLVMPGIVTTEFARNALGAATAAGSAYRPPASAAQPQTAEEVAAAIARLIEHPQAEIFTNPAQVPIARRYYEDIAAFEEQT
ncbi:MAG TPA: SDR family NAD(P)-dependent oxidoreductase [Thermoanaerobaculia bacterium]|nr:SDR family NAD(P)-dependent oxidoreductase [Thermoanaerobaculia bacterium]